MSRPKKKNSMNINIGNKYCPSRVDETPTPTRIIRNCEELGLFQDLQNVNPFEETFKKAVASGKTGSLAIQNSCVPSLTDDNTLHTPHVSFPHIIEHESGQYLIAEPKTAKEPASSNQSLPNNRIGSTSRSQGGVEERSPIRSANNVDRQEADTSQPRAIAPYMRPSSPVQIILTMLDGRLMQINALNTDAAPVAVDLVARGDKTNSVILHTVDKKPDSDNISSLTKQKLKARLGNNHSNQLPDDKCAKENSSTRQTEQNLKTKRILYNADDEDEHSKKKKALERNRAAAMRCREKRKAEKAKLKWRAEQLERELADERKKVVRLKALLLAHRDCSVTRAMANGTHHLANHQITTAIILSKEPPNESIPLEHTTVLRTNEQKGLHTVLTTVEDKMAEKAVLPKKKTAVDIETADRSQRFGDQDSPIMCGGEVGREEEREGGSTIMDSGGPAMSLVIRPANERETSFQMEPLPHKRLRTVSNTVNVAQREIFNKAILPKKKRLSLDIETANHSQRFGDKARSPIIHRDPYLSSTLLTTNSIELETLRSVGKPVGTHVIQVNPNSHYKENRFTSLNLDAPLLPISP